MNIFDATESYEQWVRGQAPLIPEHLELKHREMSRGPFEFLCATYYRWSQIWSEPAGGLASTPSVPAVGDLHVENFGTWRDAEGRLVWGVNDFDEADELPFASDLLRLGVSALIALHAGGRRFGPRRTALAILEGYHEGIKGHGQPFVLEERHPALRAIAEERLKDATKFWKKLQSLETVESPPPKPARRLLEELSPDGVRGTRVVCRIAGLGSLGRRRFTAVGELAGGLIAREVKELVPAASAWASDPRSRSIRYSTVLGRAVRCPDPFLICRKRWVGRRLSPSNGRIELAYVSRRGDIGSVLHSMGAETANIHLGGLGRKRLLAALQRIKGSKFVVALKGLEGAIVTDWERWREG